MAYWHIVLHSLRVPVVVPDLVVDSVQELSLEVVPHALVVIDLHLGLEQRLQRLGEHEVGPGDEGGHPKGG